MKTLIKGNIEKFVPVFRGLLNKNAVFTLTDSGDISMTVDTGFSGGIALPAKILEKMNIELVDYDTFRLATGKIIELPVFMGKVVVKNHEIETWFIPGDFLLGMEFLSSAGSALLLNFKENDIRLMK